MEGARKKVAAMNQVSALEEVRQNTSKDPSSWADAIIAERDDRL